MQIDILDSITSDILDDCTADSGLGGSKYTGEPLREPGYTGKIDHRIRNLSYSSLLTLHSCPRKFELYRKKARREADSIDSSVTFAYGHVVGEGIQQSLEGRQISEILFNMFLGWHAPSLFSSIDKDNKNLWSAITAVQKFHAQKDLLLPDYELVYYKGKPATELSFAILLPDGFRLRGFVDAVLRHRHTGQVIVLECKTSNSAADPAKYKNSAQGIGYSIVLDAIFPGLSSYDVLYFAYDTKNEEFTSLPFTKTYLQRAVWIRELLLDIETIKMYEGAELYPMRGESCYNFRRSCEYFETCSLDNKYVLTDGTPEDLDTVEYQVTVSLLDLLEAQLSRA